MPEIPAARRLQASGPPAERNQWRCPVPGCGASGWAENAKAAETAGIRHYVTVHDQKGA